MQVFGHWRWMQFCYDWLHRLSDRPRRAKWVRLMAQLNVDRELKRAKAHERKGEIDRAQALYRSVLAAYPNNQRAQQALAVLGRASQSTGPSQSGPNAQLQALVALYQQGQFNAVAQRAMARIKQNPNSFVLWNLLGLAQMALEKGPQAVESFGKAIALNPRFPDAHSNMGIVLHDQGELDAAIASFQKALELRPDFAIAHFNIGKVLHDQGQLDAAIASFRNALKITPDYADAYINLGNSLQDQGKLGEAIDCYQTALRINPNLALAHYNLANALKAQGRTDEAIESYEQAVAIKPDYAMALDGLGTALLSRGRSEEAIECYQKALAIDPDAASVYANIGNCILDQGQFDKAFELYRKAIAIKPDEAAFYGNMGGAFLNHGRFDEAISSFQKALEMKPDFASQYRLLVSTTGFPVDDEFISKMEYLYDQDESTSADRCHLCFGLYSAYNKLGRYQAAFDWLVEGNNIRQKELNYDIQSDRFIFEYIKNSANSLSEKVTYENSGNERNPVFILGMPRSGTTLVEQIISAHSAVFGAGELPYFESFAGEKGNLTRNKLKNFRRRYLSLVDQKAKGRKFFTDKMPHNFQHLPLILSVFPGAKIVHVYRDPAATCWSNFANYFAANGLGYACNVNDVREYYSMYVDLMEFWSEMFGDRIYHLDYDRLTENQPDQTRQLIDYIGLEWQDACLSPHQNTRAVQTLSNAQVREPIYKGSSEKWRVYEPFLDGAFDNIPRFMPPN
jgi:tetratricopeptide (TPR) repeat protein